MRTFVAAIAGLVATVAFAAALPLGWVATHLASEDGYVDFSQELVDDTELRADLVSAISAEVVESSGASGSVAPVLQQALTSAATALGDSPEIQRGWQETQRQSHQATFGDPRDLDPDLDTANGLVIDLGPLAAAVVDLVAQDLPTSVDTPEQILVPVAGANQQQRIDQVRETPQQARIAAVVAGAAAVLALLVARRRTVVVAWLGAGALVVTALSWIAAHVGVPALVDRNSTAGDLAGRAEQLLADRVIDSFDDWLTVSGAVGLALLILGLVGAIVSGARSSR